MRRAFDSLLLVLLTLPVVATAATPCARPLYLSFDTGHMGVAPLVAEVLARQEVKATFFLANERTQDGGSSLDDAWAPWWRARAAEGHAFGSHTWDHDVWLADAPGGALRVKPTQGAQAGRARTLDAAAYCAELARPAERLAAMTGQRMLPLFRAPAGRTSPALLAAAKGCGWTHVGWSPAGFLGDELPSETASNAQLLQRALRDIRSGDILLAHLGIWSRKDPWAPAVLEPLIVGLKARGFCFATLDRHPQFSAAARAAAAR
ncbi:MAG: polysaccharide deacetylase family protein [Proteobacteria bacterium]|nr:polysaccharide deacetylase family protein [Pseudomonadota bacterium]